MAVPSTADLIESLPILVVSERDRVRLGFVGETVRVLGIDEGGAFVGLVLVVGVLSHL